MSTADVSSIQGWFAGRLPDGWFSGADITIEDDQIVVLGKLPEDSLPTGDEAARESFAAGRIARFRDETRGERIGIAREAEERFEKYVTWGAVLGGVTKRFTQGGSGRTTGSRGRRGHHGRGATHTF
ncbi:MAG TPA: hypothetical protein VF137_04980 [Candidatus Dormibacteraeota bacterium]